MADIYDKASDIEQQAREHALAAQAMAAASVPKMSPAGHCLNPRCGEPFSANDNRLFCGRQCADEHARFTR